MNKRKVLVISNMYPTNEHKSFGIFVKNQVEALKEEGLDMDVIAIKNPSGGKVNVLMKYFGWFLKAFINAIFKGKQYEVVHAHYIFPSGMLGLIYKKLWNTRLVVTSHGGDIDKMARKNQRIFDWTKKILHESDEVIAVGEELKEKIHSEFLVPNEKISLLNMGVNRETFKPLQKKEARKSLGLPEDVIPILFVGNIIKQKGLLELIEAINRIRKEISVKLYIIGAAKDPSFKTRLDQAIEEKGLHESVEYLGVKDQMEIAVWMSAAEAFVLPSHIEGFGLVALEAMSCGTPVVGTNVGGLRYLLANGSGVLVEKENPGNLADGIKKAIGDSLEKEMLIENGYNKAEENDQKTIIKKVLTLYFPTGG
ncbi:glycosyltransferase [Falsibacillus pallidus]|uniref:glycosyltransferase n=1 Tax=Falsibacillus pallidus TaxID=493781 RepID=UPI003D96A7A7